MKDSLRVNDGFKTFARKVEPDYFIDSFGRIRGEWEVKIYDRKGEIVDEMHGKNVITNLAKQYVAHMIHNPYYDFYTPQGGACPVRKPIRLAIGKGSGTPTADDTALFEEITYPDDANKGWRKAPTTRMVSDNQIEYYARWDTDEANNNTITEAGLFVNLNPSNPDQVNSGTLFNHVVFPTGVDKTDMIVFDLYIYISYT